MSGVYVWTVRRSSVQSFPARFAQKNCGKKDGKEMRIIREGFIPEELSFEF